MAGIVGLLMMQAATPIAGGKVTAVRPSVLLLLVGMGVTLFIVFSMAVVVVKLYVRTRADEAFFRTGMGIPRVVIDGGCLVVPTLHEVVRVTLRSIAVRVDSEVTGPLRAKDLRPVEVTVEVSLRVPKTQEAVKEVATLFGEDASQPEAIGARLREKIAASVAVVTAEMTPEEIHRARETYAERIWQAVEGSVDSCGLKVDEVTLSRLDFEPAA